MPMILKSVALGGDFLKDSKNEREVILSFDSLLINKMRVAQVTKDAWQRSTKVMSVSIPCRIMYDTRLMKDYKGEDVLSAVKVFCKPKHITLYAIHHEDQLQLDIENWGVNHPIIIIKQPQNSVHIHHAEVWLK